MSWLVFCLFLRVYLFLKFVFSLPSYLRYLGNVFTFSYPDFFPSLSPIFFSPWISGHTIVIVYLINPHIVRWWSSNKNSTSSIPRSKNGKPQKRGKVNLIGRLQLSTEKSKEEDNEGIVQLRILRTQVNICMCLPLSCKKLSIFLFFLPCVLTNIFFH